MPCSSDRRAHGKSGWTLDSREVSLGQGAPHFNTGTPCKGPWVDPRFSPLFHCDSTGVHCRERGRGSHAAFAETRGVPETLGTRSDKNRATCLERSGMLSEGSLRRQGPVCTVQSKVRRPEYRKAPGKRGEPAIGTSFPLSSLVGRIEWRRRWLGSKSSTGSKSIKCRVPSDYRYGLCRASMPFAGGLRKKGRRGQRSRVRVQVIRVRVQAFRVRAQVFRVRAYGLQHIGQIGVSTPSFCAPGCDGALCF